MSVMHSEFTFRTAICTDYEKLLFACQHALEKFHLRREQVAALGFVSKSISEELLRLETAYARAYAHLEWHDEHCQLCRFVSKLSHRNFSSGSTAGMEKKVFV
jgi:hypothetical protein